MRELDTAIVKHETLSKALSRAHDRSHCLMHSLDVDRVVGIEELLGRVNSSSKKRRSCLRLLYSEATTVILAVSTLTTYTATYYVQATPKSRQPRSPTCSMVDDLLATLIMIVGLANSVLRGKHPVP